MISGSSSLDAIVNNDHIDMRKESYFHDHIDSPLMNGLDSLTR